MRKISLITLLGITGCAPESTGNIIAVQPAADGEWDDPAMSPASPPAATIQAAIDAASAGDTVSISSGTYVEDLNMKEGVHVDGAGLGQTIIVGTVTFTDLTDATLTDVSIYDYDYAYGGSGYVYTGIHIDGGNATISSVGVYYTAYGIHADNAGTVDIDSANIGGSWYGVFSDGTTDMSLTNSFIYSNPAGGIATDNSSGGQILHNTVIGNGFAGLSSYLTGGISQGDYSAETVVNNVVVSNYYGMNCYSCTGSASYNLVWGNTTDYVNDASAVSTDISSDPLFEDPNEGDYSISSTSPCIDAGSSLWGVATDIHGEARPQGDGYDIGDDEYALSSYNLLITEVMANAAVESTGEFVEIYNNGDQSVDLDGMMLTDGDEDDTLQAYSGSSTTLAPGAFAVVVDPEYADNYDIPEGTILLTTGDTEVGNGLTTADEVKLYQTDGATLAASFSYPKDPGDGISMEMYNLDNGDASGNWRDSVCADGSSPGAAHCFPESGDPVDLIITEVMANPADSGEAAGEYVEVYNPTETEIDLSGLIIDDGDRTDTLVAFQAGSTLLGPGEHGLILDSNYNYNYYLPTEIVLVTISDNQIGSGLTASSDPVYLYKSDGTTLIDSYTFVSDPGNGVSMEKVDYTAGDTKGNWAAADSSCDQGSSPGRLSGVAGGTCGVLLITEVMANADDEDTGEFIELYNAGADTIDLAGLIFSDGDQDDTLQAYDGSTTSLSPGNYAVIVDAEYAGEYSLDGAEVLLTSGDTTLGNALSVSNEVYLYEPDGSHLIDAYVYPSNPGNAISIERINYSGQLDDADNWTASTCASGSSPGLDNCVSGGTSGELSTSGIIITEIMANAAVESTGEFVELYNAGADTVDLLYWVFYDGDAADTLFGFDDIYDTELAPGAYALILDSGYNDDYIDTIAGDALLLTTDDATLGSGLAVSDDVYLYESDASTFVDSFTFPSDPGNGISTEKIDYTIGDAAANWQDSTCDSGSSPGQGECP